MSNYMLFLDDERFPSESFYSFAKDHGYSVVIARTFEEFKAALKIRGMPNYVTFDHDLGEKSETGLDCAKFMVTNALETDLEFPNVFEVHSMNPIGAKAIHDYLVWAYENEGRLRECFSDPL